MRKSLAHILLGWCVLAMAPGCATPGHRANDPLAKLENSFIFAPTSYPDGNWQPAGLAFEDAWFSAPDGIRLHGWYVAHENPRAVVLFAHGNAGNLSHRADPIRVLHDHLGVTVMIFDYRGYGRSQGSPDEAGILQDTRAARAWLARRAGVDQSEIVLMGRSLGGAVMVDLAAAQRAKGLILESTFTSLPDLAARAAPWIPAKLLMRNRLDSLSKIGAFHGPLLMSHGDADQLIPYRHGQLLFAAANHPKRFVDIPGGDHNDPQTPEYYRALDEFFGLLPPSRRP